MVRIATLLCLLSWLPAPAQTVSGERIRAHVKFLSSDLLEGRGVGVRGGDLATQYIATQFELAGAKPAGDNGGYFQKVPLVGVTTQADARLTATGAGKTFSFRWLDDFVGADRRQRPAGQFEAEAVFVGHGIVAPEYQWDDFKGADVKGKILILFTNEPTADPNLFKGRTLTYYGRWTYKYEQALRLGALGAFIIHTAPTAGYGWEVVRNSWSREDPYVKLAPGEPELAFAGWLSQSAGGRLLALSGHSLEELLKASESRSFRPIPLGVRLAASIRSGVRVLDTRNVAAMVPGVEPGEAVVFSAHWDHLGVGTPVNGDVIYNGAIDNATGCGILLEIAREWAALPHKPRRSALFLAVTAEEGGLRGSEYYGQHPLIPPGKTAAAFNYDALKPFGRTTDVVVSGAERTTLWPLVEQVAKRFRLTIKPDPRPEQGSYYRSDHFSFARYGIPAFSIHNGNEFAGKPPGYGDEKFREYNSRHYHQPSDEYQEEWDFTGLEEMARFGFVLGLETANMRGLPAWNPGDEFLPAREAALQAGRSR
ncbi:MAG: M28 family peptidase [Acidobacteria bacterium]|nr:M28 family peptidase [Acidobacteriota bacterium]